MLVHGTELTQPTSTPLALPPGQTAFDHWDEVSTSSPQPSRPWAPGLLPAPHLYGEGGVLPKQSC